MQGQYAQSCALPGRQGPHQGAKARVVPILWGCERCADLASKLHLMLDSAVLRVSKLQLAC